MTYSVEISSPAAKALATIEKKARLRIVGVIELLAVDPRPPGVKMLRGGQNGRWRAPAGGYRIVYTVEDDRLIVLVLRLAHRREAYERSKNDRGRGVGRAGQPTRSRNSRERRATSAAASASYEASELSANR